MRFLFGRKHNRRTSQYTLGIDIGSYTIKLVVMAENGGTRSVRHLAQALTPLDAVQNNIVVAPRETADVLRRLIAETGVTLREAGLVLPMDQALVRWVDLPPMDTESLSAAAPFEASKYLRYPVEEAEVQLLPVSTEGEGDNRRLRAILAATPHNILQSRAETLHRAGLEVAFAEIEAFSLVRALQPRADRDSLFWRGQSRGYIQIGEQSSGICVAQDADIRFLHTISWGSSRLIRALMTAFDLTAEAAHERLESTESLLDAKGIFYWEAEGEICTTDVLAVELARLRRETERVLNYYRSLFPERSYGSTVSEIVLSGGLAGLRGLAAYLTPALQVHVHPGSPFERLPASEKVREQLGGIRLWSEYAATIGTVLCTNQAAHLSNKAKTPTEFIWRRAS